MIFIIDNNQFYRLVVAALADWLNFMSHLEYIYILNQDLTKFYKDPPPMGDFSIAPQLKLRRADRQRGHIVMVKTYFTEDFSNISHHTNIHLNNLSNYYFVCAVQRGRRPSVLYWPAATANNISRTAPSPFTSIWPFHLSKTILISHRNVKVFTATRQNKSSVSLEDIGQKYITIVQWNVRNRLLLLKLLKPYF